MCIISIYIHKLIDIKTAYDIWRTNMKYKDYYETLGVNKNATQAQIKKAYRKLAKKYHPDTNPGDKEAENMFKAVNEAYEVLGDPERRKKYDNMGQNFDFQNGYDFDPSRFGFGRNVRYEYTSGADNDFSDFFNMFFGRGGIDFDDIFNTGMKGAYRRKQFSMDGDDREIKVRLSPEEGFKGVKKRIRLAVNGQKKTINFKIPRGINEGEKIKLAGQGIPGKGGGKNGDLYLVAGFESGKFKVNGSDLETSARVSPWDAALGAGISIETLDGRISVNIPPGIQTDQKIRVSGKGYINKPGARGDLYITVKIVNPKTLTSEEKKLYKKLSDISEFKPGN